MDTGNHWTWFSDSYNNIQLWFKNKKSLSGRGKKGYHGNMGRKMAAMWVGLEKSTLFHQHGRFPFRLSCNLSWNFAGLGKIREKHHDAFLQLQTSQQAKDTFASFGITSTIPPSQQMFQWLFLFKVLMYFNSVFNCFHEACWAWL